MLRFTLYLGTRHVKPSHQLNLAADPLLDTVCKQLYHKLTTLDTRENPLRACLVCRLYHVQALHDNLSGAEVSACLSWTSKFPI